MKCEFISAANIFFDPHFIAVSPVRLYILIFGDKICAVWACVCETAIRIKMRFISCCLTFANPAKSLLEAQLQTEQEHVESKNLQRVILELCSNEAAYYKILSSFVSSYCERLKEIVVSSKDDNAIEALHFPVQDIENIFGKNLINCKEASEELTLKLSAVAKLDGHGNMLQTTLNGIKEIFPKLKSLSLYAGVYLYNIRIIKEQTEAIRTAKRKRRKKSTTGLNFLQIWEVERVKHQELEMLSLENILIKPIQRIAQYKTFFKEILRLARKENHPLVDQCEQLVESTDALGQRINYRLNQAKTATKKYM